MNKILYRKYYSFLTFVRGYMSICQLDLVLDEILHSEFIENLNLDDDTMTIVINVH